MYTLDVIEILAVYIVINSEVTFIETQLWINDTHTNA